MTAPISYSPAVFHVDSIEAAKAVILTPEGGTTKERWEKETPYVVALIREQLEIGQGSVVLDYGCGIGRIARELILQTGCFVVGVDISPSMRALAAAYVASDRFLVCAPGALADLNIEVDQAISVWTLQHALHPPRDIALIRLALKPGGGLFVLNNKLRAVPINDWRWADDGVSIEETLDRTFKPVERGALPKEVAPGTLSDDTFWKSYRAPTIGLVPTGLGLRAALQT